MPPSACFPRSRAFDIQPPARARRNAVNYGNTFFMADEQAQLLAEFATKASAAASISSLGCRSISRASSGTGHAGRLASASTRSISASTKSPEASRLGKGLQAIGADKVLGALAGFFEKILDKVKERIGRNVWVQRTVKLLGIGSDVAFAYLQQLVMSRQFLGTFVPFWGQIKAVVAVVDGVVRSRDIYVDMKSLDDRASEIGSGVPTLAIQGFRSYLNTEVIKTAASTAYTFGKSVAASVLTVPTAAPVRSSNWPRRSSSFSSAG